MADIPTRSYWNAAEEVELLPERVGAVVVAALNPWIFGTLPLASD